MADFIDSMIDAAFEKLDGAGDADAQSANDSAAAASNSEVSPQVQAVEGEEPQETKAPSAEIKESRPSARDRDQSGKFVKGAKDKTDSKPVTQAPVAIDATTQVSDQAADGVQTEASPSADETVQTQPIETPTFWSSDLRKAAAEAPRALVEKFIEHDVQREQWARQIANEAEQGKQYRQKFEKVFEPYKLKLQAAGIDEAGAVSRLMAWSEILEKDLPTGLVNIMRNNNLTPEQLSQFFYGDESQQNRINDPRLDEALAEAKAAKEAAENLKKQLETNHQSQVSEQINAWKAGKDSRGQVRKQFAEAYSPQIMQSVQILKTEYPQIPFAELLTHAYEYELKKVTEYFGIPNQAQPIVPAKAPEKILEENVKAKAAASSVSGAPTNGVGKTRPKLKGKTDSEWVGSAVDRAEERLGIN